MQKRPEWPVPERDATSCSDKEGAREPRAQMEASSILPAWLYPAELDMLRLLVTRCSDRNTGREPRPTRTTSQGILPREEVTCIGHHIRPDTVHWDLVLCCPPNPEEVSTGQRMMRGFPTHHVGRSELIHAAAIKLSAVRMHLPC